MRAIESEEGETYLGIGHFAVGLALKKAEPRISLGPVIFGAYLADFLLGVFVWLGREQYHIPPDFAAKRYMTFTFPYSHGLAATLLWSALAALIAYRLYSTTVIRAKAAWIVAGAVFSHFVLDAVVHVGGLPILGDHSYKLGLGLWNHLNLELTLEVLMVIAGLILYLRCTHGKGIMGRYGMIALVVLLTPAMVLGQAMTVSEPPRSALIESWIIAPLLLGVSAYRIDRARTPA
jgi:membrane-bound metal-dependent hydrolase YbcI (DUF457 family)